jgi:glycosyltransferase involved in cell wall biosynthesis
MAGEPDGTDPLTETTLNDLDQPWIMRLGPLTHMREFYAALDIFCLPSHREGFPNVNLEAAATGLPVVTTTATGCIDSVISGVDGLLVQPHDPNALALAIEGLVRDSGLRHTYGQQGRDRVIELFDERRINSLLAATLDDLAQSSVRRHGSSKRGQASR